MSELYRHFAKDGRLLYIGISLSTAHRLAQHSRTSRWFAQVTRVEIERFPSRREAAAAERIAIRTEQPPFNIALTGREKDWKPKYRLKGADRVWADAWLRSNGLKGRRAPGGAPP